MEGKRESKWAVNLSALGVTVGVERMKTREFQPSWKQSEVLKDFRSRFSSVIRDVVSKEYDRAVIFHRHDYEPDVESLVELGFSHKQAVTKANQEHNALFRQRLVEAIVAHLGEELEKIETEVIK